MMYLAKKKNEMEKFITKTVFADFMDRLGRWHGVIIDPVTQREFAEEMEGFLKCDFKYCLDFLLNNPSKYPAKPIEIYRLCRENKLRRLKDERLSEEKKERNISINKEGREKVKQYLSKIGTFLNKNGELR